ncbi:poly-gamma-glutamate synthesis protein (capsule biosynthesis protein) [Desulfotomaculum arcticum]|uniref:Poly-gamma-glutamate synthesis protein (Capsule biosynthesis protein) n=1 Tax=Desulfotruncus arcticus DSM 17038 TaxID=1121424 RepID=A0A1I2N5U5_9FIRM|nr:CapA family protein [Desulfotruncus arcticus]SFF99142.1 poly-gamma-glutamate synthesis protein (capsule biosynthesis protein) [Desulfotomaculum arcticum] [Desulfotruncus arcticus DSM 17038]
MARDTLVNKREIIVLLIIFNILIITFLYLLKSGNIYNYNITIQPSKPSLPPLMKQEPAIKPVLYNAAALPDKSDKQVLSINMTGDIMLASNLGEAIKSRGTDFPWLDVRDILAAADFTIGNLECAVGSGDYQPVPNKQYTFLAAPDALAGLQKAGFDVLTLANNHILDFGTDALAETLVNLDNCGILHAGAGISKNEAIKPTILEKNGIKIGIIAFSRIFPEGWWVAGTDNPGIASGHDYQMLLHTINELSKQVDIVIISMHWGEEMSDMPTIIQQNLAHKLIESGADCILGHHPHVLQGVESYNNGLIFYSAGNFIFTLSRDTRGRQSVIINIDVDKSGICGARLIPAWIEPGRTILADEKTSAAIIKRLQNLSGSMGTTIDANGEIELE